MRVLAATVLLLLLNLQPLAGAALCLRHHATDDGAACESAMAMAAHGGEQPQPADGGMTPMAQECALAMACAAPAPVVTGTIAFLDLAVPLLNADVWPPAARGADAPATPFFRPPIS